jgi:phosphoglycolate phosphatase-like HAD superfamily hydrolase
MTVLLFDIDGTLVLTGGAGIRAMKSAFEELFEVPDDFSTIEVPGRTDTWILSDAFALHGLPDAAELSPSIYLVTSPPRSRSRIRKP